MLVNLTPHQITLVDDLGNIIQVVEPEATSARCSSERQFAFEADSIRVNRTMFGEVSGLPDEVNGTWYIVSRIVAEASGRSDLIIPDETVRNAEGQIIGCKSFATLG